MATNHPASAGPRGGNPYPPDMILIARIDRGNAAALALLFDRYGRRAFALARRLLGDATAVEGIVHDVFLAVWAHPNRFAAGSGSVSQRLEDAISERCRVVSDGPDRQTRRDAEVERLIAELLAPPWPRRALGEPYSPANALDASREMKLSSDDEVRNE